MAQPLETQFAQIPGVSQMTSISTLGSTAITLQFDLNRNIDGAASDVQAAINAAGGQLPKNLPSPPTYRKVNPADSPILLLGATSDTLPMTEVDDNVETKLAQQISQIPGVAQVIIGGQQKPAIRIQLDPAKLVAKGLSLEDVRTQLSVATVDEPKGTIDGENAVLHDLHQRPADRGKPWNDVIVAYRNGGPLRVRDIGSAVDGPQDNNAGGLGRRQARRVPGHLQAAGRQRHSTRSTASWQQLPRLEAAMPPAIKIFVLSDRTQTIRAAVHDVQFTLLLTIALVVMVIFVFLRSLWATIIPSVTVPLALLGACALMWAAGYSLDNLSLMALTISVGFVVDDAIVMLENITRYIEEGEAPLAAALKGSRQIAFTIVSISISLIAVLIPLLLMGGIIGRLFREFAVTLSMTIVVSAVVSLTLTPMMASRFLTPPQGSPSWPILRTERTRLRSHAEGLRARARCCARITVSLRCWYFSRRWRCPSISSSIIPKGFFPQQDTGLITGISEAGQDVSFAEMMQHQEALGAIVLKDPAVDHVAMAIGGAGNALNTGRMFITLEAARPAHGDRRPGHRAAAAATRKGRGSKTVPASGAGRARRRPAVTHAISSTRLQGSDLDELNQWATKVLAKLKTLPELRDVASDQQTSGTTLTLTVNRDQASRYGLTAQTIDDTLYDAFGQREIAQYFTQLSSYEVIMEVLPALQGDVATLDKIFLKSPTTGGEVPLSTFAKWTTTPVQPLSISHQGQFPAITISFNLAPGRRARAGDPGDRRAPRTNCSSRPPLIGSFQGTAQAFQASLSTVPLLILWRAGRGLPHPRHPLRKLHPSDHHSVDAAFGRRRRAGDADAVRFRFQPDRPDRHHPAHRHREEKRHHARRFRHRRRARRASRRRTTRSAAPRCCGSGRS